MNETVTDSLVDWRHCQSGTVQTSVSVSALLCSLLSCWCTAALLYFAYKPVSSFSGSVSPCVREWWQGSFPIPSHDRNRVFASPCPCKYVNLERVACYLFSSITIIRGHWGWNLTYQLSVHYFFRLLVGLFGKVCTRTWADDVYCQTSSENIGISWSLICIRQELTFLQKAF